MANIDKPKLAQRIKAKVLGHGKETKTGWKTTKELLEEDSQKAKYE